MPEAFDPLGIVAGLIAHGVSYVLVGELAARVGGAPTEADRVAICVPGDQANLARLGVALDQLGARQRSSESGGDDQASLDTIMGRLDVMESTTEFEDLNTNASNVSLGRGVVARVASLEDLARSKRASADLSGAARLAAFVDVPAEPAAPAKSRFARIKSIKPAKPAQPGEGRVDRILEKLASVDEFLTQVDTGQRSLRRKKDE